MVRVTGEPPNPAGTSEAGWVCEVNSCMAAATGSGVGAVADSMGVASHVGLTEMHAV